MRPPARLLLVPMVLIGSPPAGAPGQDSPADQEPREVPEVIVIGTPLEDGVPVVPLHSTGSRDVFGPERVRETGARDVNDLVNHLPALSTRPYNGGEAAAPSLSMRGLPDDGLTEYVHVLIDGMPANSLPYGWTAFSFLPIATERIHALDFIRGGHAVRYSPNTVGGVLNFITQPVPDEPMLEFRSTLGSFDYSSTLLRAGGMLEGESGGANSDFGALFSYVDRRGEGYRRDGGFDQQDANLKLRYGTGESSWLNASFTHIESEHQAPGGLTQAEFRNDPFANGRPENRFDGFRTAADLVHHTELEAGGWVEFYGWFSETGRELRRQQPHFGAPTELTVWDDEAFFTALGARFEQEFEGLGLEHTLYGGVRLHREWIPSWKLSTQPFPSGPGTLTQDAEFTLNAISLHVDDTVEPFEDFLLTAGVRTEWIPKTTGEDPVNGWTFEEEYFELLPGVGASYLLTDEWALFGNYNEGFRTPQVWGYAFTAPNAELVMERGRSFELGTRFASEVGLEASATAWRTVYDDFGVFFTGFYENLGKIDAQGVDLVLGYELGNVWEALDGFSVWSSLTMQNSELQSGPDAGNEVPYAWEQKASWILRYDRDDWIVSLSGAHVGESFSDNANTTAPSADGTLGLNPGRTIWDGRVARRFFLGEQAELEVSVGATNLLDESWFVHSRGGFFGGGLVAGPPRQAFAAANVVVYF